MEDRATERGAAFLKTIIEGLAPLTTPPTTPPVPDLKLALHDYVRVHKSDPTPFIRTKPATDILDKVTRARSASNQYQSD